MNDVKPILFNTDMVRAILDGRKTVTRRVVNHKHLRGLENLTAEKIERACKAPYKCGDVLYVRETWARLCFGLCTQIYVYRASEEPPFPKIIPIGCHLTDHFKWRPSIHMPKDAARIFLRVTGVRVERLQDITDEDVVAEGLPIGCYFDDLWDKTVKPADRGRYGWKANPWVWVIEFERCKGPEV